MLHKIFYFKKLRHLPMTQGPPFARKDDASPARRRPTTRGLEDITNAPIQRDGQGWCERSDEPAFAAGRGSVFQGASHPYHHPAALTAAGRRRRGMASIAEKVAPAACLTDLATRSTSGFCRPATSRSLWLCLRGRSCRC